MNISGPFIRRPIATSLIAAALLGLGLIAYFNLAVAALPQVDAPTIQISAILPGASPETMASNVATPLERQLSLITGVSQMTSSSSLGRTPSLCSSTWTATSTPPPRTCSRRSMPPAGSCPPTCPARRRCGRSTRPTTPC